MKQVILIAILMFASGFGYGQTDTIRAQKRVLGVDFYKEGKQLSARAVNACMNEDARALKEYRKGKTAAVLTNVFMGVGVGVLAVDFGAAILKSDNLNPVGAGIGIGLIAVGIPFTLSQQAHFKKAVFHYNRSRNKTGYISNKRSVGLAFTGSGISLQLGR